MEEFRRKLWCIRQIEKHAKNPKKDDFIIKLKREYRKSLREYIDKVEHPSVITFYDWHGESRRDLYLVELPEEIATSSKSDIEDYLWKNFAQRNYSDYDCTGRWFTNWFKFAFEPGSNRRIIRVCETLSLDV